MKRCHNYKVLVCCLLVVDLVAAFFLSADGLPKSMGFLPRLLSAALVWFLFGILVPMVHPHFQALPRLLGYGLVACICGLLSALSPQLGILQLLMGLLTMVLGWLVWSRWIPKDSSFTQDMNLDG